MLRIAGIVEDSVVDGPGLRITIFGQGCPHQCIGCHNPETWPEEGGTRISKEQVYDIVKSNPICRGVTFSGGEPFAQAEGFAWLGRQLKADGYEIAAYTGYTFEQLLCGTRAQQDLLETIDVLIDGPFVLAERSMDVIFRGSRNQRILNVRESLAKRQAVAEVSDRWLGQY